MNNTIDWNLAEDGLRQEEPEILTEEEKYEEREAERKYEED